ncbi:hypothetical protein WICPIJ_000628 [Wickerhamomyces pijperi]|uniref:Anaphase-promoting complex subunit 4 WD40 domain-containing protein n=1 Tax=Wickerhamomyces pijperi TaxID=599730 RepID=A0A9P8TRN2_WICPI|nr:hypothetical protein WICPIJ_000628 [Wickerhamomyces pijperi]
MSLIKRAKLSSEQEPKVCIRLTLKHPNKGHNSSVLSVRFNRTGDVLATGGMDKSILLWSLPHSNDSELTENYGMIEGHKSAVTSLSWMGSDRLASSSADMSVGIWDTNTGERLRNFREHTYVVNQVDTEEGLIASASDDGTVRIWDQNSKKSVHTLSTEYPLLTVQIKDKLLYTAGIEPMIRCWDIRSTSTPLFEIETQHSDMITSLSVDQTNMISRSSDDTIRLYEPNPIPGNHIKPQVYSGATSGDENLVIRCLLRGHIVYSGSSDNTLTSWDLSTSRLIKKQPGHKGTVLDIDEFEGIIATSSVDGNVILRY